MKRKERGLILFLVLSLLLHLLFLLGIRWPMVPVRDSNDLEVLLLKQGLPKEIADIMEPPVQEKPKEPNFLGIYDSRTEEETVAPGAKQSHAKKAVEPVEPGPELNGPKLSDQKEAKEGEDSSSDESYLQAYPEDFFPDYKIGAHTYLNVLRFPKIGYFVRLKKIFRTTFDPSSALRQQSFQVARGQVEVVLGVTIGRSGSLDDLFVISSSGLPLYDAEGVRTVQASAPFAAPPKELLDAGGRLRMSWTFIVYL